MKSNPIMSGGNAHGARAKELQHDLEQLSATIADCRTGEASKGENAPMVVRALEREYQTLEAEWQREIALLSGGTPGAVLAKGQSMRDAVGSAGPDIGLGQIVRGLGFGRWDGVSSEAKAMIVSDGAGGAIPGAITAGIVDLARQGSVLFRGGAQLMPIAAPSAKVARMTSAPAAQWEPESAERELSDQAFVFDAAELTATTAWLYATVTVEASEDVLDLDAAIMNHFAQQLALTFDEAGLVGTGVDQPVGLVNMGTSEDRVLEMNDLGEISSHVPFVRAVGAVKAAHHEPSSVVLTPGLWTELACLQDTTDQPLRAPAAYQQLTEYVTDFLPATGGYAMDEHTAIVGDLSAMTFGVRTGATLEISRLGAGFAKGAIELRAYLRIGWYLTRPEAICIMRGITLPVLDTSGY